MARKNRVIGGLLLIAVVIVLVQIVARPTEPELRVGQSAPEFVLPNALGGEVSLADYMGNQPVLVYFSMGHG